MSGTLIIPTNAGLTDWKNAGLKAKLPRTSHASEHGQMRAPRRDEVRAGAGRDDSR
jgi:hypothetical protein